jgi:hypothetical protein
MSRKIRKSSLDPVSNLGSKKRSNHLRKIFFVRLSTTVYNSITSCAFKFVNIDIGIHRLVKLMKGRSSCILRQEFPWLRSRLPTLWTNSYFVATVGGTPLATLHEYIEKQKYV